MCKIRYYGNSKFLVFKDGDMLGSYIGKERKSIAQIDEFLAQYC